MLFWVGIQPQTLLLVEAHLTPDLQTPLELMTINFETMTSTKINIFGELIIIL